VKRAKGLSVQGEHLFHSEVSPAALPSHAFRPPLRWGPWGHGSCGPFSLQQSVYNKACAGAVGCTRRLKLPPALACRWIFWLRWRTPTFCLCAGSARKGQQILVVDFMENGSLASWLRPATHTEGAPPGQARHGQQGPASRGAGMHVGAASRGAGMHVGAARAED